MLNKKSIAFWGAIPPPIGGMTVHIQRLSAILKRRGFDVQMYNFTQFIKNEKYIQNISLPFLWYFSLFFKTTNNIHYVISTRSIIRFLAVLYGIIKNKKIIIRVGGKSLENSIKNEKLGKFLNKFAIQNSSAFIGVNEEICALAKTYKKEKVFCVPGFIFPEQNKNNNLPKNLVSFFNYEKVKIVVSGKIFNKNKDDIYGIRDMIKLGKYLLESNFEFKIMIFLYDMGNDNIIVENNFVHEIKKEGLSNNIFVYTEDIEICKCLFLSDIFLRPSYTDGDCNTLREAMYYNLHTIATDVVPRPKGVKLYKAGNNLDLFKLIKNLDYNIKPSYTLKDNSDSIIKIIENII